MKGGVEQDLQAERPKTSVMGGEGTEGVKKGKAELISR
jgi:hypothetical protein